MIRFKQRMSLCSEVSSGSDGSPAPPSIAGMADRHAQSRAEDSHSPPLPAGAVPPVIVTAPPVGIGRVDSSQSIQMLPPSSDSSLSSSSCNIDISNDAGRAPVSHVEIHPKTKIPHAAAARTSTPPVTTTMTAPADAPATISRSNNTQSQLTGRKRTVSDANDEDSSSSLSTTTTSSSSSSSSKRPRTHHHQTAKDSADSSSTPNHSTPPPTPAPTAPGPRPRLLACPADPQHLSPLHCFVRRQIELFAATAQDVSAPCPGRKVRIQCGQVGLRCIHCKRAEVEAAANTAAAAATTAANTGGTANPKQPKPKRPRRVKRALCYPSKVSRIYNSVSDMKFDHFGMCPHMPQELREEFGLLKALHAGSAAGGSGSGSGNNGGRRGGGGTVSSDVSVVSSSTSSMSASTASSTGASSSSSSSSSSSTARYYHETALLVGLMDAPAGAVGGGIRFGPPLPPQTPPLLTTVDVVAEKPKRTAPPATARAKVIAEVPAQDVVPAQPCVPIATRVPSFPQNLSLPSRIDDNTTTKTFPLAALEDEQILNPIHCFVRRNVEVFAATAADIAAPAPGRKNRIVAGQVGIRCVHCAHLPPRDRVKRSICYPPNVSGIYHAVSNMKFDHFSACRGLDGATRAEFQALRASCGRKGGGRAKSGSFSTSTSRPTTSSSTAQYYHDSALNLGLVDTSDGIRLLPEEAAKLRAAAAMVIQAHQGPPSAPSRAVPVPTKGQIPLTSAPLPPLGHVGFGTTASITPDQSKYPSSLPNFAQREPIPDGLSALMMAASQRSAEYAPQMATAKLAI